VLDFKRGTVEEAACFGHFACGSQDWMLLLLRRLDLEHACSGHSLRCSFAQGKENWAKSGLFALVLLKSSLMFRTVFIDFQDDSGCSFCLHHVPA
jgi:hypothetical protein